MGRVPILDAPPAMDRSIPYTEREFTREVLERNLNLCDDELRLERRAEDMFEYAGDDEETDGDLIPMSPEETDDLLRKARVEQGQNEPGSALTYQDAKQEPHSNPLLDPEREKDAAPGRGDIDESGDRVDTPELTTPPFIPSDGPNDPDRTWYDPS